MLKIGIVLCNMFTLECDGYWLRPAEMTLPECKQEGSFLVDRILRTYEDYQYGAYICVDADLES